MTARRSVHLLIDRLMLREGGFVDHPADRGGPTKYGITIKTLSSWRGRPCNREDVEALSDIEASDIYYTWYWAAPKFDTLENLSPVVVEMLFDTAVHSGPGKAVKILQRCAGLVADGVIGPVTRAAIGRLDPKHLAALFMGERVEFLGELITDDPSQAVFAHGWMRRMREFIVEIPLA